MYRFIWKIELSDEASEAEFIRNWVEGSRIIQECPGAMGTHLHRMRDNPRGFFAVAEWESMEARDVMQAELDAGETPRAKQWQAYANAGQFGQLDFGPMGEEVANVLPANDDNQGEM